jgi:hypothetical protein
VNAPTSEPRFVFVVPLRNPSVAHDWDRCVALCADTLNSALNQTAPGESFRVILVCREFPENLIEHPSLEVIRYPFPNPTPNWENQHHDKYLKIRHGLARARDFAPCYVMKLDADDLVNNRLVTYVLRDNNRLGYFVDSGYRWHDGSASLQLTTKFYKGCGSSNILYAEKSQLPIDAADVSRQYDLVALGHNITVETLAQRGTPLRPIPFPAAIYRMTNGENITTHFSPFQTNASERPNWKFYVGHLLRKLIERCRCRRITSHVASEFSISKKQASQTRI